MVASLFVINLLVLGCNLAIAPPNIFFVNFVYFLRSPSSKDSEGKERRKYVSRKTINNKTPSKINYKKETKIFKFTKKLH